jgi:subtilisin family serine protease
MIGLVDGPVATNHPDLAGGSIREIKESGGSPCARVNSTACLHGTFVAGILSARRSSAAPAICPGCTLLVRPIFRETPSGDGLIPSAKPEELATAIVECVEAGARVINLSLALAQSYTKGERALEEALDRAAHHGAIVVAAAGNQGLLGSTTITRHPWVIPVVACDLQGKPMELSNLGRSIGRRGLAAPGQGITSLGAAGRPLTLGGTSAAAPFVTGAIGLLWSEFPNASAASIKLAITRADSNHRTTVVPPLLNASRAHQYLLTTTRRKLA